MRPGGRCFRTFGEGFSPVGEGGGFFPPFPGKGGGGRGPFLEGGTKGGGRGAIGGCVRGGAEGIGGMLFFFFFFMCLFFLRVWGLGAESGGLGWLRGWDKDHGKKKKKRCDQGKAPLGS